MQRLSTGRKKRLDIFFKFTIFDNYHSLENKKTMKNIFLKSLPLIVFLAIASAPIFAQSCNPNVPIDGGLSILIAAGAGYGAKKLYNKKKED